MVTLKMEAVTLLQNNGHNIKHSKIETQWKIMDIYFNNLQVQKTIIEFFLFSTLKLHPRYMTLQAVTLPIERDGDPKDVCPS